MTVRSVVVHSFMIGDVDDPDIWAGEKLYTWEQSDMAKWVKEHAIDDLVWNRTLVPGSYGYKYTITTKLSEKDYLYFLLKWDK